MVLQRFSDASDIECFVAHQTLEVVAASRLCLASASDFVANAVPPQVLQVTGYVAATPPEWAHQICPLFNVYADVWCPKDEEGEKEKARRERLTRKILIEPDSLLAQQKDCGGSMKTEEEDMSSVGDHFHRSMPPHTANHPDMTLRNS